MKCSAAIVEYDMLGFGISAGGALDLICVIDGPFFRIRSCFSRIISGTFSSASAFPFSSAKRSDAFSD